MALGEAAALSLDEMRVEFKGRRQRVDSLAGRIAIYAARLDAGEHQLLTTIREFDELRGWLVQGARSCAAWLSHRIGVGLNTAREKVRVAVALRGLPQIDDALRRGQLSYAKARAMTRVATPENEDLLLAQARGTTGAQLERICAKFRRFVPGALTAEDVRYVRRRASRDGTIKVEMSLLPDEAELVWQVLQERRKQLEQSSGGEGDRPRPTLADAAVDVARQVRPLADESAKADIVAPVERTLFVHLVEESSREEISAESGDASNTSTKGSDGADKTFRAELDDGTPICGATMQRLACDAGLVMASRTNAGAVLDIGRKRRTLTSRLTRALQVRDRTCRFPGCTHRAHLDAHHIEHWCNGGQTKLDNLVRLCHFHHVAVHEGGFQVRWHHDRPVFYTPDGQALAHVIDAPTLDPSTSAVDQLESDQSAEGITIDERTSLPRCHGLSHRDVDIHGCINALIRRSAYDTTRAISAER